MLIFRHNAPKPSKPVWYYEEPDSGATFPYTKPSKILKYERPDAPVEVQHAVHEAEQRLQKVIDELERENFRLNDVIHELVIAGAREKLKAANLTDEELEALGYTRDDEW